MGGAPGLPWPVWGGQGAAGDPAGLLGCLLTQFYFLFSHEVNKSVSPAEQQLWKKSFSCFEKGIHNFESIEDATNAALLLCNTGRLMRICAQAHCGAGDALKREFSPEEGLYYNKVTRWLMGPSFIPHCSYFGVAPLTYRNPE